MNGAEKNSSFGLAMLGFGVLAEPAQASELSWLLIAGGVMLLIALLAVFVVPRFLDNVLGIVSVVGVLFIAGAVMVATQLVNLSSLTTAAPYGKPDNLQVRPVGVDGFTVRWETERSVISALKYGKEADKLDWVAVSVDPTEPKKVHEIFVSGLEAGVTYYIKVISGGEVFPEGEPLNVELK
jgi:hypothetical protein